MNRGCGVSGVHTFGMLMPGRVYQAVAYLFGFNGQIRDDELSGIGNKYYAMYWEYEPRLGRRMNLDPKEDWTKSKYLCFNNSPVINSDPLGDKFKNTQDQKIADQLKSEFKAKQEDFRKDKEKYTALIAEAENRGDNKAADKYMRKAEDASEGEAQMYQAQMELDQMRDDQNITVTFNSKGPTVGSVIDHLKWSGSADNLTLEIPFYSDAHGLTAHESKHAAQVLDKYLTPDFQSKNSEMFSDATLFNEKEGYARQYFVSPSGLPSANTLVTYKDINANYILNITNPASGAKVYPLQGTDQYGLKKFRKR